MHTLYTALNAENLVFGPQKTYTQNPQTINIKKL